MDRHLLESARHIHMIGIKGAGMAALAQILVDRGKYITGSDTDEVFFTDAILKGLDITVHEGFSPENIPSDTECIIYSTSYDPDRNDELRAATERFPGILLSYPEAVGALTNQYLTLAVCGTHGKTTTSALLGHTLLNIGDDPTAIVGSAISDWKGGALSGKGQYFVLEADEYQNKLKEYQPFAVILTSADWDHPDFFPDIGKYAQVFIDFVQKIPKHGVLVYCGDSALVSEIAKSARCRTISYGRIDGAEYRIGTYSVERPGSPHNQGVLQRFNITKDDQEFGRYSLRLAGIHNTLNATAVIALLDFLKKDPDQVCGAIEEFPGTERRFEFIGERFGALCYDDYAHHPEEIRATLRAFRELFPEKALKVIFHPHTFTRTKALLQEFAQSFEDADSVHILDIYGSAREIHGGVRSQDIIDLLNRFSPGKGSVAHDIPDLVREIEKTMGRNDIIISMGAGDVWKITHMIARQSDTREKRESYSATSEHKE